VFAGAAGADGVDLAEAVEVPVAVADLDVHPATGFPGGEEDGRGLAVAFPADSRSDTARRVPALRWVWASLTRLRCH
jgi:hypothetical protein